MVRAVGGALLVFLGVGIGLDGWGLGRLFWRFWLSSYRRWGLQPRGNALFIRGWFGALLVVIGAAWIYAGLA
jgi:hypothetical protein